MKKILNGIVIIVILDIVVGFYFGANAILWQSSESSWRGIIIYNWPFIIYGLIVSLPFIWISVLTIRLKKLGRRLNIILFLAIILMQLSRFLNKFSIRGLIILLFSIGIVYYLARKKIKGLFN